MTQRPRHSAAPRIADTPALFKAKGDLTKNGRDGHPIALTLGAIAVAIGSTISGLDPRSFRDPKRENRVAEERPWV
jgi:hypothetical protein